MMTLFRLAEQPSWWHPYRDLVRPQYAALLDLEVDASEIRTYHVIVPGLFQTTDYARQVLLYGPQEIDDEEVERHDEHDEPDNGHTKVPRIANALADDHSRSGLCTGPDSV